MELSGKAALITGGKRIGQAVAERLASRGVVVARSYARSKVEAVPAAATVRAAGRQAAVIAADLTNPGACAALVDSAAAALGRLDILINMASVYVQKPFDTVTVADWDAVHAVDLRAAFLCSRAAVPHMRTAGGGRIVNFSD